jgi:hypothetical protein
MIKIDVDVRGLTAMTLRESKRLAYSTATAINRTMQEIQREERAELDRRFQIRKNAFMYRLIKIFVFAKVPRVPTPATFATVRVGGSTSFPVLIPGRAGSDGSLFGEIGIDTTKARVLLPEFVEGGYKEPVLGKTVGVPVTGGPARPSFADPVTAAYQLSKLNLQHRVLKDGSVQLVTDQDGGLFSLPQAQHSSVPRGLFQKVGDVIKAVYLFVARPPLKKRYDFVAVAERVFNNTWDREFDRAYDSKKG